MKGGREDCSDVVDNVGENDVGVLPVDPTGFDQPLLNLPPVDELRA